MQTIEQKIIETVFNELKNRSGFEDILHNLDNDVLTELTKTCETKVKSVLPEYKYVWLNINTGFSNSWDEELHRRLNVESAYNKEEHSHYKLIHYCCLTDDKFEFFDQMKLK